MHNKILVSVKVTYMADQTLPRERYVYSYTINIANVGDQAAQLISRHWLIRDAKNKLQEVQGVGVIGEQPHIVPGESFTYTSGVVLETETGIMEGTYEMRADNGDIFDAEIPAFALVPPHAIH
ncbi:MAG: Co2+/Mg2+ efflux protein ApaG [Cellvibrio sp.]